jgi:hypothetical protein
MALMMKLATPQNPSSGNPNHNHSGEAPPAATTALIGGLYAVNDVPPDQF